MAEDTPETADPAAPVMEGVDADSVLKEESADEAEVSAEQQEVEHVALSSEESESSMAMASLDELLDDPRLSELDEEDDFVVSTEEAPAETVTPPASEEDETVSFSDLIQAIDEEIVYVAESPKEQRPESSEQPILTERADEKQPASVAGRADLPRENGSANGHSLEEHATAQVPNETNREAVLVDGIKYYKNNEYDKAIAEFKKVLSLYPDYKEAHSILGNAYFRNKMYNEAAIEYQKVKEIDPEDITAYENMGVIYANRGEYREAVGEWKKVIELSPTRVDIEDKIRRALRLI